MKAGREHRVPLSKSALRILEQMQEVREGDFVFPGGKRGKPRRAPDRAQRTERLEREIEAAEAALAAVEDELGDPAAWSDQDKADAAARRHADAQRAVEHLYAELEAITT